MKYLQTLFILLALFPLAACQSLTAFDLAHTRAEPPANLVQPCPPPALIPDNINLGQLLQADGELAQEYWQCANRHNELVKWLTRAK